MSEPLYEGFSGFTRRERRTRDEAVPIQRRKPKLTLPQPTAEEKAAFEAMMKTRFNIDCEWQADAQMYLPAIAIDPWIGWQAALAWEGISSHEGHREMSDKLATTHLVVRTSPKGPGQKFIGTCSLCGKTGLPAEAALDPCENVRSLTVEQSVLEAITGEPSDE